MNNKKTVNLSIVTTLFKSAEYITEFHKRLTCVAKKYANANYEIIYVNNNCPDDSDKILREIILIDTNTYLIDLSNNFGHHNAIMSGMSYAKGDLIFLIDSDLEEEPELFFNFLEAMRLNKCDVVYGVQKSRRGGIFEKVTGYLFYKLFNFFTKLSIEENLTTARLMTRRYVNALTLYEEREVTLAGLWQIVGFKQVSIYVKKIRNRKSTYTFTAKMSLFINAITSFSNKPLILISYVGLFISSIALLLNIVLVLQWLFFNKPIAGWTSIIASIWLIGGMLILFIGIIGIYIAKIYTETKKRPRVIIREIVKNSELDKY